MQLNFAITRLLSAFIRRDDALDISNMRAICKWKSYGNSIAKFKIDAGGS